MGHSFHSELIDYWKGPVFPGHESGQTLWLKHFHLFRHIPVGNKTSDIMNYRVSQNLSEHLQHSSTRMKHHLQSFQVLVIKNTGHLGKLQ